MEYLLTKRMPSLMLLFTLVFALGVLFVGHLSDDPPVRITSVVTFSAIALFVWLYHRIWKTEGVLYTSLPADAGEKWVSLLLISAIYGILIFAILGIVSLVEVLWYPVGEVTGSGESSSYIFSLDSVLKSESFLKIINVVLFEFSVFFYALIRFRKSLYVFFVSLFAMIALLISLSVSKYLCLVGTGDDRKWYVLVVVMSVGFLVASYHALKKQQQK